MAFDTRYRPIDYDDVLGQDATVAVLRQFVKSGSGYHQSYLFCGQFGSGKTTLGRILARALLCENPQDGNPCNHCSSCRSMLEKGSSECYSEMDAATKSGKDNITRMTEELAYSTTSGKRRIYLFDEAHQLSKQALDALLKPMEDTFPGTEEKQMVCIFCTTEPEKMRSTVFSRCAPAFVIKVVSPGDLAPRMAWICEQEGLTYEHEALVVIAEATECHIRDALKAIEGISMLGAISLENVHRYLRTDTNATLVRILRRLGEDLGGVLSDLESVCQVISPTTAYEKLVEASMLAYKVRLSIAKAPSYWNDAEIADVGVFHGDFLLQVAQKLSSRPGRPTHSMLALDLAQMHQIRAGVSVVVQPLAATLANVSREVPVSVPVGVSGGTSTPIQGSVCETVSSPPAPTKQAYETSGGVFLDTRAVRRREGSESKTSAQRRGALSPEKFREALLSRVLELRDDSSKRQPG